MTLPRTGPFDSVVSGPTVNGKAIWVISKRRYKQAKPYNLPLVYRFGKGVRRRYQRSGSYYTSDTRVPAFTVGSSDRFQAWSVRYDSSEWLNIWQVAEARNKAREQFREKTSAKAELLVNFAERKQAVDMIAKRGLQFYRFLRALRKFRFEDAAKELGLLTKSVERMRLRRSAHALADNVLEYSFGWRPLIADVRSAVEILSSDFTSQVVGRGVVKHRERIDGQSTSSQYWNFKNKGMDKIDAFCRFGATVRVNNPNLALASRMGLTNPAAALWELMPWSFVVDYFVNVGDWLNQFSEFHGVDIIEPYYTDTVRRDLDEVSYNYPKNSWAKPNGFNSRSYTAVYMSRTLGIPNVTLRKKGFIMPVSRAATSISLLIKQGIKRN